jgi:hypothetical protein
MALTDGFLNLLHLFFTMLLSILFDGSFLLFSDCACPVLDILDLLLLLSLERFLFLLKEHLVEVHHLIVIELSLPFHLGDLDGANLLDTPSDQLLYDLLRPYLPHEFQFIKQLILLALFLLFDLLHYEVLLPFDPLCLENLLESLLFFGLRPCDLFLHLFHVGLPAGDLAHLLLDLLLDLEEYALPLLVAGLFLGLLDQLERRLEFVAEPHQVPRDFHLLVECDARRLVVQHGAHETLRVALVQERLDRTERVVEHQQVLQSLQLQVLEIVTALLQYTH